MAADICLDHLEDESWRELSMSDSMREYKSLAVYLSSLFYAN